MPRGTLLDRHNRPIASSAGTPGNYTRRVEHAPLGPVVGYTHPIYGQTGLEASLDPYLRGVRGTPSSLIWSSNLLYAQRPDGLNVRLSIDLDLQTQADRLLGAHPGAVVLLNAQTGEVLAMASHPYYDPNRIEEQWDQWMADPDAPLLNRATQGQYPLGTATGPYLLAFQNAIGRLPALPGETAYEYEGETWDCSVQPGPPASWGNQIAQGCAGSLVALANPLNGSQLANLYRALGFGEAPDIQLPVAEPSEIEEAANPELAAIGQNNLRVSPLQAALAASTISNSGRRPSPLLAAAVNTPHQGWVVLPNQPPLNAISATGADAAAEELAVNGHPLWGALGAAFTPDGKITWYQGGTRPEWRGSPLAVAVVLEEDNPTLAREIGLALLQAAITP